jgi:zinc finger FYVE domain-containing protein 1
MIYRDYRVLNLLLLLFSELIKDSARPDYWVPDADIHKCCVCHCELPTAKKKAHHCRDCGQGVCQDCSNNRRPVSRRGWDTPVRVCNTCFKHD